MLHIFYLLVTNSILSFEHRRCFCWHYDIKTSLRPVK